MRIKRKNGLKMIVIALVLLLCLALAVGITGAYYQAKRQATGTLSMDQGIVIDYNGFDKTTAEEWATWTRGVTLPLFETNNAQPGEQVAVNAAGIRANAESVNFYARVKLSYKFYNGETPVELADATKLITISANFFGTNWVDGGSSDGYYYYATGTTLNKFNKGTQTFIDLFATDAKFVIEGEHFTGATSNGEGGGFVVGDTSINKIEVYLTLETLQGDVQTDELNTLRWKIAQTVDFSKVEEGKIVKSNTTTEVTDEKLNVTINDKTTSLETVKFPYDEEVILNFDSRNVDYITLNYSNGETETFGLSADDFANDYLSETALKVTAKSSKGTVKGYTVGLWDSEYTGFSYSRKNYEMDEGGNNLIEYDVPSGVAVTGYLGNDTEITIPASAKVRERDFKSVISGYNSFDEFEELLFSFVGSISYPCNIVGYSEAINSMDDLQAWYMTLDQDNFMGSTYKENVTFKSKKLISSTISGSKVEIKEIGYLAFAANSTLKKITIEEGVNKIAIQAFSCGADSAQKTSALETIILPNSLNEISPEAFQGATNLKSVKIGESATIKLGGNAFFGCSSLSDIDTTRFITLVSSAFEGCSSLINVVLSSNLIKIENGVFIGCNSLKALSIQDGNANYYSVDNCLIEKNTKTLVVACKNSILPNDGSITIIGDSAFAGLNTISEIVIPEGVTIIGENAFWDCTGLTKLVLPSTITEIKRGAFIFSAPSHAASTNSIVLIISATVPPTNAYNSNSYSFMNGKVTAIYVPAESVEAYKAANGWKNYADKIQAIA